MSKKNVKIITLKKEKPIKILNEPLYPDDNISTIPSNPLSSYTDLSIIEKELLDNYVRVPVDEIANLKFGTRIKYVEKLDNGYYKVKLGGTISLNKAPLYLMLAEGGKSWSVQLKKHFIYVEQTKKLIKEYTKYIEDLEKRNNDLQESLHKLHKKYNKLKDVYDKINK